ncbi:hypothetical protein ACLB2K_058176 [Fragaria x ananassa]
MVMCKSPPRSATQLEQVTKPKLAGKVMKQKINPKPKLAGKVMKQKINPKPKLAGKVMKQKINQKAIDGRTLTLFKKGEELATLCDAQVAVLIYGSNGSVQTWPNNSKTVKDILLKYKQSADKKISNRSFKSMKNKVADTTGEELHQNPCFEGLGEEFELRDEEFEKLTQDSLMGLSGFFESKEQNSDETINLIEGSSQPMEGSTSIDHPENSSNCNPPIELAENIWDILMSEDFDKGQALLTDSLDSGGIETSTSNSLVYQDTPYGIGNSTISNEELGCLQASRDFENYSSNFGTDLWTSTSSSLDYQNTYFPDFPTVIPDSSSSTNLEQLGHDRGMLQANGDSRTSYSSGSDEVRINNNVSLEDIERLLNDETMTGSEEHQSCASAASISGYSTPTSCQSGRWRTDTLGLEAAANNVSNFVNGHDQQGMVAPKPSPLEEVLTTALQPKHLELQNPRAYYH